MSETLDQKDPRITIADTDLILVTDSDGVMYKRSAVNTIKNKIVTLTDSATVAWDFNNGNIGVVTLGGNRTLSITNATGGCCGLLYVKQDATGSRTITLPGNLKTGFALSTGANEVDLLAFNYDGTDFWWAIDNFGTVGGGGGGSDADADAFIAAASVVDTGHQDAITTFVLDLKSNGFWTKMRAFYMFYGTGISTAKFNLKDPSNTDAAGRLTETGTFTYSDGVTCTSLTSGDKLDTHVLATDSFIGQNDVCLFASILTDVDELKIDIGSSIGASTAMYIVSRNSNKYWGANNSAGDTTTTNTSSIGRFYNSRTGSGSFSLYKNGSSLATITSTSATPDANSIGICGVGSLVSSKKISMAGIFKGLTSGEIATLDGLIDTLETALGR